MQRSFAPFWRHGQTIARGKHASLGGCGQTPPRTDGVLVGRFGIPGVLLTTASHHGHGRWTRLAIVILGACLWAAQTVGAQDYYVATTGNNTNPGTLAQPFRTVQKAADVMQPGDTVYIRAGIYREKVTPPRGGTSESARITYRNYPGERPVLMGSERFTTWEPYFGNGVYSLTLDNSYFGSYNPYVLTFGDAPENYWVLTRNEHPGEVFFNGQAYAGISQDQLQTSPGRWTTRQENGKTVILAHFGGANPNIGLAEITVRREIFRPSQIGIGYITISGLKFDQAATQWSEPDGEQCGMINTYWGHHWIIENCHILHAKTVGISSGIPYAPVPDRSNKNTYGNHIVRNN
jgi:hypothetical protein